MDFVEHALARLGCGRLELEPSKPLNVVLEIDPPDNMQAAHVVLEGQLTGAVSTVNSTPGVNCIESQGIPVDESERLVLLDIVTFPVELRCGGWGCHGRLVLRFPL
jgi:hypothetical protein